LLDLNHVEHIDARLQVRVMVDSCVIVFVEVVVVQVVVVQVVIVQGSDSPGSDRTS